MESEFSKFIAEAQLLKKIKSNKEIHPFKDFHDLPFNCFCKHDKKETTFLLRIKDNAVYQRFSRDGQILSMNYGKVVIETVSFGDEEEEVVLNKFDETVIYEAVCQLCKKQKIEIIIKIYNELENKKTVFFAQKIGQFPPIATIANKETYIFLREEDKHFYEKARQCLVHGFGMGAFAYFRRIIENEIKHIIEELIEAKVENYDKIKNVYIQFNRDHQMGKLIDETNIFIPESLKFKGRNPLHILYHQLSIGIHNLEEEECLDKAESIDFLFNFIICQLNREKNEISKYNSILKKLLG